MQLIVGNVMIEQLLKAQYNYNYEYIMAKLFKAESLWILIEIRRNFLKFRIIIWEKEKFLNNVERND